VAFTMLLDKSLQSINPKVCVPYWDFNSECLCSTSLDVDTLSDGEVLEIMNNILAAISAARYDAWNYISAGNNFTNGPGVLLSDEDQMELQRHVLKIWSTIGKAGHMSTGAASNDPIFWILHPIFDRALHTLRLSATLSEGFDFTWIDGTCYGSGWEDYLPFTDLFGSESYTRE
jgi:hypothetical protein